MSEQQLGAHGEAIRALQKDMTSVKADVKEVRDFVIDVKARWRTIVTLSLGVGAFAGAVVAFFADIAKTLIEKRIAP